MDWRQKAASIEWHTETGRFRIHTTRDAVLTGAVIHYTLIPTWPSWVILPLSVLTYVGFYLVGWAYKRLGWMAEASNVPVVENVSRPTQVNLEWQARLLEHYGIPLNHVPAQLRPEIVEVLEGTFKK